MQAQAPRGTIKRSTPPGSSIPVCSGTVRMLTREHPRRRHVRLTKECAATIGHHRKARARTWPSTRYTTVLYTFRGAQIDSRSLGCVDVRPKDTRTAEALYFCLSRSPRKVGKRDSEMTAATARIGRSARQRAARDASCSVPPLRADSVKQ